MAEVVDKLDNRQGYRSMGVSFWSGPIAPLKVKKLSRDGSMMKLRRVRQNETTGSSGIRKIASRSVREETNHR